MVLRLNISEPELGESIVVETDPETKVIKTINSAKSYWSLDGEYVMIRGGDKIDRRDSWSKIDIEDGDKLTLKKVSDIKKMPKRLWKNRIENEIDGLKNSDLDIDAAWDEDGVKIRVQLKTSGPIKVGDDIGLSFKHEFEVILGREYPYTAPEINWNSDIFHPNIAPPEEGGRLRIGYIDPWDFSKSIVDLVHYIEKILMEPEIDNKVDESTCVEASKKYLDGNFPEH
ncbi:MAG: ubiquitin-conjugating enzyme E2 [Thermoplasmatota archaeon]